LLDRKILHDRFDRRDARWLAQVRGLLEATGSHPRDGQLPADPDAAVERIEWEWEQDHVVDQDLNTVADVDALNAGATNIHATRVALTGEASTEDDTNNRANVDAADIVFGASAGVTALGALIYDEGGGTDATRDLVWGMSFATGQPVDGGLTLTVADFLRVNTATA